MVNIIYGTIVPSFVINNMDNIQFKKDFNKINKNSKINFVCYSDKISNQVVVGAELNTKETSIIQLSPDQLNEYTDNPKLGSGFNKLFENILHSWVDSYKSKHLELKESDLDDSEIEIKLKYLELPDTVDMKWYICDNSKLESLI